MKKTLLGAALALSLTLPVHAQDAGTVVASVDGTDITLGNLIAMRDRLPAQYQQLPDDVLYDGMMEQLIQQQVLADAAREALTLGDELGLENEIRAYLAGRLIQRIMDREVNEEDVKAAYQEAYGSTGPETEYNASHILVETEPEARALVVMLQEGADFAELAREHSTGPSGPNGGELGWFGSGVMVPEFEAQVTSLEVGAVSEPVQTQFGWHVITLNQTREKDAPELETVRAELEQGLRDAAVDEEVQRLTRAAEVTTHELGLDRALIRNLDLLAP